MVMISFESPALWSLHIIRLLWGWTRGEERRAKRGGEGGCKMGGSLPVKAAEQKEKTNSSLFSVAVVFSDFHKTHRTAPLT